MEEKLPVKRLNRLSWLLAIIIGIIFYIIISHSKDQNHAYIFTFFTFLGILITGYADVGSMIFLEKRCRFRSKIFTLYRYLFTYPSSILIYLLLWLIFASTVHLDWSFWDVNLFLAFVGSGVVVNTMVITLHDSVLLYEHKLRSELELSRLRAANAEATNLLLKQQIHPHFLFNAMNTLKALYHSDTQVADTYLVHMANFLRASVFHHSSNVSSLEEELKLLNDYLAMQQIRFGTALECSINLSQEALKKYVLPSFSLQPLMENAIKHNNFTPEDPLRVNIVQIEDRLVFSNNLQKKKIKEPSTNYGLANLAERYRLGSGEEVLIKEDENTFSVSIKLLKNENRNH
ncbi:sensor histidine kinase [Pedobacter nutrimenti]|uniref:Histidine kinase n=1 Tax=Pedobacter nutrimenti TaxID=1241337 RepID=A0A318UFF7_9SPHI|nr:histidine kinase [Pedobacter nutrimenti]PYF74843.1 histidine kinase [Pedobacter nutrimenti]